MTILGHWAERRKVNGDKLTLLLMKNGNGNQWNNECGNTKIHYNLKGNHITLYIGDMFGMTGVIEKVCKHSLTIRYKIRGKCIIRRYVRCHYQSALIKRLCLINR
jgi:hypothetical protein